MFTDKLKIKKAIILLAILVAITAAGYIVNMIVSSNDLVDSNSYQAIFLDNGEVYFGNITDLDDDSVTLENIYYLQVSNNSQLQNDQQLPSQPEINLIKLGNELHGPQDKMFIPMQSIVYWENLEAGCRLSQVITETENGNLNTGAFNQPQAQPNLGQGDLQQPVQQPVLNEVNSDTINNVADEEIVDDVGIEE